MKFTKLKEAFKNKYAIRIIAGVLVVTIGLKRQRSKGGRCKAGDKDRADGGHRAGGRCRGCAG